MGIQKKHDVAMFRRDHFVHYQVRQVSYFSNIKPELDVNQHLNHVIDNSYKMLYTSLMIELWCIGSYWICWSQSNFDVPWCPTIPWLHHVEALFFIRCDTSSPDGNYYKIIVELNLKLKLAWDILHSLRQHIYRCIDHNWHLFADQV